MYSKGTSNYTSSNISRVTKSSKTSSKASTMRTEKLPIIKQESPEKEKIDPKTISKKELQEKEYEEEVRKKKLKEQLEEKKYRNISVRISPEENILCLSIDGSQTSKDAFEIILFEFLPYIHNSVMICPHIYNNTQDEKFNWRFQKAHVLEYYKTRLTTSLADYQGYLIIQDRDGNKMHEIEQSYKIAEMNQCKYFFCGYEGLREQALKPSRIDVGIEYLLGESKIPVFIMKDNKKRGNKNKGFQWLLVMDKSNSDCYRVLDLFLPLVDRKLDKIYGFTLMPQYVQNDDDVKKKFYEKMEELNFKEKEQFEYSSKQYISNPSTILADFVNHNSVYFFDFVIFLNNPMKFKSQKHECETFKYVKLLYANIGFCNYAHIYGYDYKVISKLPSEKDPRKYLDKIQKPEAKEVQDALNLDLSDYTKKEKIEKKEKFVEKKEKILGKKDLINIENKENIIIENDINKDKITEEIYSEIYGVDHGNVFERVSPAKPKNNDSIKKAEVKIEPKNLGFERDNKRKTTWAPTNTKKQLGGSVKCPADDATKKSYNSNYGTNKTNRNKKLTKTTRVPNKIPTKTATKTTTKTTTKGKK
jgi:hypothetical protein